VLHVLAPGALSTVQDLGRPDHGHLGVPAGGACDRWSLMVANRLLGNAPGAAALEMTLLGGTFEVMVTGVIAIAGADMDATVVDDGRPLESGASHLVHAGTSIRFGAVTRGLRTYLALPGGVAVPEVLGSRSTCLPGGFGGIDGRPLTMGDRLAPVDEPMAADAGRRWPSGGFDPTDPGAALHFVAVADGPGVHPDAVELLVGSAWTVSPVNDRSGVRLDGATLPADAAAGELVSRGVLPGAIQVPASGQPIVLLADAPTIGGYPVPGVVASADLPIVAQRPAGEPLRLVHIGAREARTLAVERRASAGG
jgi:urea carboxylase